MPDFVRLVSLVTIETVYLAATSVACLLVIGLILDGRIPFVRFRPGKPTEPPLWSGIETIGAIVLYFLLLSFVGGIVYVALDLDPVRVIYFQPLIYVLAGGGVIAFVRSRVFVFLGQSPGSLGLQRAPWPNAFPCAAIILLAFYPLGIVMIAWTTWLEAFTGTETAPQVVVDSFVSVITSGDALGMVSLVIGGVVLAPAIEELLFRSVLFGWLRRRWGTAVGVLVSSAAFAAFHLSPSAFLPLFFVGVLLAAVYHRTRSVLWAIFAHGLFNASQMLMMVLQVSS
jgi:membrane protease YdiL (CAAX protease family)